LNGASAPDALVVLAGGRSSRFGGDKALAEFEGESRAARAAPPARRCAARAGAAPRRSPACLPTSCRSPIRRPVPARLQRCAPPSRRCQERAASPRRDAPELEPRSTRRSPPRRGRRRRLRAARRPPEPLVAVWSAPAARFAAEPAAGADAMHRGAARARRLRRLRRRRPAASRT
jgi:hypothetical protein